MRPTPRCLLIALLGFAACVPALVMGPAWWVAWPIYIGALVIALAVDLALSASARQFSATATMSADGYVGAPVALTLHLTTGRKAPRALRVALTAPPELVGERHSELATSAQTTYDVAFSLRPVRRGAYQVSSCMLQWLGPLGLLSHRLDLALHGEVTVAPNIEKVKQAAIRVAHASNYIGQRIQRYIGDGSEFEQLR